VGVYVGWSLETLLDLKSTNGTLGRVKLQGSRSVNDSSWEFPNFPEMLLPGKRVAANFHQLFPQKPAIQLRKINGTFPTFLCFAGNSHEILGMLFFPTHSLTASSLRIDLHFSLLKLLAARILDEFQQINLGEMHQKIIGSP